MGGVGAHSQGVPLRELVLVCEQGCAPFGDLILGLRWMLREGQDVVIPTDGLIVYNRI